MSDKEQEQGPKFTPGPWQLDKFSDHDGGGPWYRISGESTLFLEVVECADGFVPGQNTANAHLISAAPDLYAACKAYLEANTIAQAIEVIGLMRAAIAKAEGRGEQTK